MQSISLLRLPKQNTIDWLPWTIETYFLHSADWEVQDQVMES